MARPRVRLENRVRSSRACNSCKASKIRCSSQLPCAACIKRNRPCSFATRSDTGHVSTSPTSSARIEFNSPQAGTNTGDNSTSRGQDSPSERFVTGSNGEKVYIGETASLSFLAFLRRHLRPYVGPTPFTDGERQNPMLENDVVPVLNVYMDFDLGEEEALFRSYSEATSGLLHLFSSTDMDDFMETRAHLKREDLAARDMALAIGAQARAKSPRDAQAAAMYFSRARSMAFEDMLTHTSLSMVKLFILLAFFTLGACQQDAAFMYLGVASKAAIVLGLHQPMSWKRLQNADGSNLRLHIWHSLCILDVLTSSILGRPCTVPRATRHDLHALPLDPTQPAFNSVTKGAALLDDVCRILSRSVIIDVATAEELLQNLHLWSQNLPTCLRRFSCNNDSPLSSIDRECFFGRVHVSGIYYFSVILITRPFLIRHLMAKLRRDSGHETYAPINPKEADLAQVCMSSAVYMGELCRKTVAAVTASDLPFGNMCLFKIWTFGAGLILGYSIFAGEPSYEFQEAFSGVCEMLRKIGEASPQSRPYKETLSNFADTISAYRRQASQKFRRMVDQYIDRILVIDVDQDSSSHEDSTGTTHITVSVSSSASCGESGLGGSLTAEDPTFIGLRQVDDNWFVQQTWDDEQRWDGVSMQFLDNFAIDYGARSM
ncbi:hypothetical protein P280DRAFT_467808 [Massarina eburnea CBS 473.64]|uniref:Zn(2)-C6 fungal-type domain-containing protein n=1 Tax=Massarina eburnea CBS 473.64 TaxID=1395130 RepID=A0A6A6S5V4_9PLEO|nr:hypothetical protein P280DRAFT_467808 [Massarina eburnea CBS 473.64]